MILRINLLIRIRFVCWNINGLSSKFLDSDFISYLSNFDICLTETWARNPAQFDLANYVSVNVARTKRTHFGRYLDGVSCFNARTSKLNDFIDSNARFLQIGDNYDTPFLPLRESRDIFVNDYGN